MNIQELVELAIDRIDSMSIDELRAKFLEHGYVPSSECPDLYLLAVKGKGDIPLNDIIPAYEIRPNKLHFSFYGGHGFKHLRTFDRTPVHEIPMNDVNYSVYDTNAIDKAA